MEQKEKEERDELHFRVAIFGSARVRQGTDLYKSIYALAKRIAEAGMDVVTGGGPGLMNAASEGHHVGRKDKEYHSIGLKIKLPFEKKESYHLDIKKEFNRFSSRLDSFMNFSNVAVVASGGVGTLLELFYTWQLLQVKHICNIPIILLGEMWPDLINWIRIWPLKLNFLDNKDVDLLFLAANVEEAFSIIQKTYEGHKKGDKNFCSNHKKYSI